MAVCFNPTSRPWSERVTVIRSWLYIICGVITMPIAISLFFLIPDHPSNTQAFYLTPAERIFANERVLKLGKASPKKLDRQILKRVFTRWHWYAFVAAYVFYGTSCQASGYFAIWLKAEHFSVTQRNIIPTGTNLISAFAIFMWGFLADFTGSRFAFVFIPLVSVIFSATASSRSSRTNPGSLSFMASYQTGFLPPGQPLWNWKNSLSLLMECNSW